MTVLVAVLAATLPLRNPFWPVGYEGEREIISDEPRVQAKAPVEAIPEPAVAETATAVVAPPVDAAALAAEEENRASRLWVAARKTLRIGGTLKLEGAENRQAVSINGRIYSDGDLVSVNHEDRRFTWRVKGLSQGGTLKLQRIKFRPLDKESNEVKGVLK